MEYKIVVDSSCDLTQKLRDKLDATVIPLTLMLGEKSFVDDDVLDLPGFMAEMKACTEKIGSAAPSPTLYKEAYTGDTNFVVTLSANLSASYSNAVMGKNMAEENGGVEVHVFDSKSASAGETLVAIETKKLINAGYRKEKIITAIEELIRHMKTYFVLDNIDNLLKNGRLNKIVGKIICLLGIKPLMSSDGDGNIALVGPVRGQTQIVERMAGLVERSGRNTNGRYMVISHCNNPALAEKLRATIEQRYAFQHIFVVPTRGLSSVYTNVGGVVMAF